MKKEYKVLAELAPERKFWFAGGSVLSHVTQTPVNDYDVFSPHPNDIVSDLAAQGINPSFTNGNIANYYLDNKKYQVILGHTYHTVDATIDDFDFTIVCAAYDGNDIIALPSFWEHALRKKLVVHRLNYPLRTLERLAKYSRRGYSACPVGLLRLAQAIHALGPAFDWSNPDANHLSFYPDGTPRFNGVD